MNTLGVVFAIVAVASNSLRDMVSKKVAYKVNSLVSAWATYLYSLPYYILFIIPGLLFGGEAIVFSSSFLYFVVLRSSTDVIGESLKQKAFTYGELTLVTAFQSFIPIFTFLISIVVFNESITTVGVVGILLAVVGSFIVVYNSETKFAPKPIILAFLASVFFSMNAIYDKLAISQSTPIYTAFMISIIGSMFLYIPNLFVKHKTADLKKGSKFFMVRGFFEAVYMILKMLALQYISATYMTVLLRLGVVFSIFNGKVFLKEEKFLQKLLGSLAIIAGIIIMLFFGKS